MILHGTRPNPTEVAQIAADLLAEADALAVDLLRAYIAAAWRDTEPER